MTSKVEQVDSVRRSIEIEAGADVVSGAIKKALQKVKNEVKMPGFRKGKVPDTMLMKKFGDDILSEAVKLIVRDTYPSAVVDAGENPISPPSILPLERPEAGKLFKYKATFEIYPEVEVKGYTGLALEKEKIAVVEAEVEAELKHLQTRMTQLEPAPDGSIDKGMIALIDFKGTAGGLSFTGSEAENYVVDFGTGNLLEEFEVEIKGMKTGEDRHIEFDYPENYFRKEIAGKRGKFKVKTKEIRKKIVPSLDDEFAKELGKYKNLDEVRADVKKRIVEYKEYLARNSMIEQAIRDLIAKHESIEVPTTLIDSELTNMIEQMKKNLEARGQKIEDAKVDPKEFVKNNVKEATDRAKGYMIISAIAAKEGVQVTDEELEARIGQISAQSRQPVEKIKENLVKENKMASLRSQIAFEKTLDFILNKAKIKEVKPKKEKK